LPCGVSLCVLPVVQDTLNKARKRDREASAEALKKIYQAETQKEAEEALRSLRGGGHGLLQDRGALGNQGLRSFSLPASSRARSPLPLYHKPTGAVGQRGKEANQSGGVFCGEGAMEKLLILGFESAR
jgi:hypothetical protein